MTVYPEALLHRAVEIMNTGGDMRECWHEDIVFHAAGIGEIQGMSEFLSAVEPFHVAFPDAKATLEETIRQDDRIVGRYTTRATHTGPFMGIPPTGNRVEWAGTDIYRIEDGKIVEEWFCEDLLTLVRQIGGLPA
jgi:steroid delta-isomerase-like uncharacterized protein